MIVLLHKEGRDCFQPEIPSARQILQKTKASDCSSSPDHRSSLPRCGHLLGEHSLTHLRQSCVDQLKPVLGNKGKHIHLVSRLGKLGFKKWAAPRTSSFSPIPFCRIHTTSHLFSFFFFSFLVSQSWYFLVYKHYWAYIKEDQGGKQKTGTFYPASTYQDGPAGQTGTCTAPRPCSQLTHHGKELPCWSLPAQGLHLPWDWCGLFFLKLTDFPEAN